MQDFIYDFKKREVVNPLDKIRSFYVNPQMPQSAQLLNIEALWRETRDAQLKFVNGLPAIVFPIELLKLEQVSVKISSPDKYIVLAGDMVLYIKLFSENASVCRIDSVIYK